MQIQGTPCDLVTGEEKRCGNPDGSAANHVAITIEMAPVDRRCKSQQCEPRFQIECNQKSCRLICCLLFYS